MPSQQLTSQQIELMALLTEQGHIRPSLLSLVRGWVIVGTIPIIRVTPGFLGTPGGYTFGWPAIGIFLDGVQEVFFLVLGGFFGGGESGEGERESAGERKGGGVEGESVGESGGAVAGGGEVGEELRLFASEGGEVVDVDSDSSSSIDSCCGLPSWLPHNCSSGRRRPEGEDRASG